MLAAKTRCTIASVRSGTLRGPHQLLALLASWSLERTQELGVVDTWIGIFWAESLEPCGLCATVWARYGVQPILPPRNLEPLPPPPPSQSKEPDLKAVNRPSSFLNSKWPDVTSAIQCQVCSPSASPAWLVLTSFGFCRLCSGNLFFVVPS